MIETVKAWLADVPALGGRIEPAGKMSDAIARNALASVGTSCFVLALGLRGGAADAASGLFRQEITEVLGLVLVMRAAGDATGARSADPLRDLRNDVIARIVGKEAPSDWGGETIGVFRLSRGELRSMNAGTLIYQLDFAIDDQLRI